MSALVGVLSEEAKWQERYDTHSEMLDGLLAEVTTTVTGIAEFLKDKSEANDAVVA